ncbi:MAG: alpha/beta hydrolase [Bacilli bacterium]
MNDMTTTLLITLAILGGLLLLYFLFMLLFYLGLHRIFTRRQNGNPHLKYFTVDQFDDLAFEKLQLTIWKNQLDGVRIAPLHEKEDQKHLIIFFHGFGAGYEAYTREIRRLSLHSQIPVIAFSLSGSGKSSGKKFPNFFQAINEASQILTEITKTQGKNRKIYLIGHSLGGFIVSNVLTLHPQLSVDGVIALSAPNNFVDVFTHLVHGGKITRLILGLFFRIQYRKKAKVSTASSIEYNLIPTTLIHGTRDFVVPYAKSGQIYADLSNKHQHIRVISYAGRGHNPYLTQISEQALQEVLRQDQYYKRHKKLHAEAKKFYQNIDYDQIGIVDEELLEAIKQIIKGAGK